MNASIPIVSCLHSITAALALAAAGSALAGTAEPAPAKAPPTPDSPLLSWKENTISPVANPIYFEDPVIRTEIRPIFAYHRTDSGFVTGDGDAQVYALQLRLKLTDRLAFIATKDGYMDLNTDNIDADGWNDISAGFKYAVIDDEANQFILTPGFTFSIPLGDEEVFQGRGDGEWDLFVSAAKGFDNAHITSNIGVRVPNDTDAQSTILHYSLQFDYYVHQYFIPFVVANGYTVLDGGNNLPLDSEGYDVINFGSSLADDVTQLTVGAGFRSRLTKNVDLGFAYEKAVVAPEGLFDDRFTFDLSIHF